MRYCRACLWAEIQGKKIYLVLFRRIDCWDRVDDLYATANRFYVNQSNMKLKYVLHTICRGVLKGLLGFRPAYKNNL